MLGVENNCCLILLLEEWKEVGEKGNLFLGLDYTQFRMMKEFKIIKNMSVGCHLLYWSDDFLDLNANRVIGSASEENMGFFLNRPVENRTSRLVFFPRNEEVLILKYNKEKNNFYEMKEENDVYRYYQYLLKREKEGIPLEHAREVLIDFAVTDQEKWKTLTRYVSQEVLRKLEPVDKKVCSSFEENSESSEKPYIFYSHIPRFVSKEEIKKRNDRFNRTPRKELQNKIETKNKEENMNTTAEEEESVTYYVPDEITLFNLDKFNVLENLEKENYVRTTDSYLSDIKNSDHYPNKLFYILGEYQLAFILYQLGFNYCSFVQWKKLYTLITDSLTIIEMHTSFFEQFLQILHSQMSELGDDFFKKENESFILFGLFNVNDIILCENISTTKIDQWMGLIDSIVHRKSGLHINDLKVIFQEYEPTIVH